MRDAVEAGMTGDRASPRARVAAGCVLIAEKHVRHAPGPPALGRNDGREKGDDGRADRCSEMGRARVARDEAIGAGEEGGEDREARLPAEVYRFPSCDACGELTLRRSTRHEDAAACGS